MTGQKAARTFDYIEHTIAAITRIEHYVDGLDLAAFTASTLVQDAVVRNFEIVGEAANRIRTMDPGFVQRHPDLRLDLAAAMRNALIHGYDSVNLLTVWNTIWNDLPDFKQKLTSVHRNRRTSSGVS